MRSNASSSIPVMPREGGWLHGGAPHPGAARLEAPARTRAAMVRPLAEVEAEYRPHAAVA